MTPGSCPQTQELHPADFGLNEFSVFKYTVGCGGQLFKQGDML